VNELAEELLIMLKRVLFYDLLISISVFIIAYSLFRNYCLYILIGIIAAAFNFFLNSVSTNFIFSNQQQNYKIYMTISSFIRVAIVCTIGILLYNYNEASIIPFLIGYSLHFLAVIIGSLKIKN
jgi:ATP synthase protein I